MTAAALPPFRQSPALSLGVELELQLVSLRDFDLTRAATDLLGSLVADGSQGDIKLEITESMIEISTLPQSSVDGIASDLAGLRDILRAQACRHNIAICGGGAHPFHRWPDRRICPGERFDALYQRYGYLAKQFTVFGQHVHVGVASADDAIWLTQALGVYVPDFIALSASSPYIDGEDTFYQSARLNAVSAFPLSGQCPPLADWADFHRHFSFLQACGIAQSIKDLYWDVRPKPEFGTVEIRVCDTPLSIEKACALTALAQSLAAWLLRERPALDTAGQAHVARYNKFQACRFGLEATIADPLSQTTQPLRARLSRLLDVLEPDARALGCAHWLEQLRNAFIPGHGDAEWLRARRTALGNLNDVVREAGQRWLDGPENGN
jgi:carboxylate-amine ligase